MEYVEALKDMKDINEMKKVLKKHSERDYVLFVVGINTGLKLTEMLNLQVMDIQDDKGNMKKFLLIEAKEGCESKRVFINNQVKKAVRHFIKEKQLQSKDYLFSSIKTKQPISRQQAYRVIHDAAVEAGIEGKIGTNSMRKTFGYHAYKKGVAISLLQKFFHHTSRSETLKYLGIDKDEVILTEIDVNL
ncbi:MAG: tyrosine-type recombinase/integrase [Bacillus sp. (in: firmicutes)]